MPITLNGTEGVDQSAVTGATELPRGTTAQRPASPTAGMIRFNTDFNINETYNGTAWVAVGTQSAYAFTADVLLVAGGGGGGGGSDGQGGGGGAGGVLYQEARTFTTQSYTVTVGAGGTGGNTTNNDNSGQGAKGSNTVAFGLTAQGGGGGELGFYTAASTAIKNGGSGGGGGQQYAGTGTPGISTQTSQDGATGYGFAGGTGGVYFGPQPGGGGGGAGGVGENGAGYDVTPAGKGGVGRQFSITGSSLYYAGGGGGGSKDNPSQAGGLGGGGNGGTTAGGGNGTANLGGGGGGAGTAGASNSGGNGGSGVVIIRYPALFTLTPSAGLTASTTTVGDNKVTTFTAGTGTISWSV